MYTHQSRQERIVGMAESTSTVPRPCACTTVRRASRVLARAFDLVLEPCGLNVTQLAVLRAIQRHPNEPLSRVAEDLSMDRTSLYRAVKGMQRGGWLTIAAGSDARWRIAEFTARGRRLLRAADRPWARVQTAIVERFGRDKWMALVSELERLSAIARAAESIKTR
jgi:DNA-binding MarR family transcriptional regulator